MRKRKDTEASELLYKAIVEGMQENKAQDIVVLDLRKLSSAVCVSFSLALKRNLVRQKQFHFV